MMDECESELGLSGVLSALSFGASFEKVANFLIDKIDINEAAPSREKSRASTIERRRVGGADVRPFWRVLARFRRQVSQQPPPVPM